MTSLSCVDRPALPRVSTTWLIVATSKSSVGRVMARYQLECDSRLAALATTLEGAESVRNARLERLGDAIAIEIDMLAPDGKGVDLDAQRVRVIEQIHQVLVLPERECRLGRDIDAEFVRI